MDYHEQVNKQYGQDNLGDIILAALENAGKDIDSLTRDDLSTFDEFHIGGLPETRNLANQVGSLSADSHVLDIGSGLGGPARTLAAEYGCQVTGLDLTLEYVQAAAMLTKRVGLDHLVSFRHGNALDMPFGDDTFDGVWSQFAGMNIADKATLYQQVQRVLKPGGFLAFHEVMAGEHSELHYPVFWANQADMNHLANASEIRSLLSRLGFREAFWKDLTQYSVDWFQKMMAARSVEKSSKPPLGFNVFIADDVAQKAANVIRNLEEGRISVFQVVCRLEN